MTAAGELLDRCTALGITLSPGQAGALEWEADADPPAELLDDLRRHKADLLALVASAEVSPWDLPADLYECWEERVTIMHFDGGLPWPLAERLALAEVLRHAGSTKPPPETARQVRLQP
jgi:hypothetical protein